MSIQFSWRSLRLEVTLLKHRSPTASSLQVKHGIVLLLNLASSSSTVGAAEAIA